MPRRRLTEIRLDKIAAVDDPCQEHATVAIIKRAPARPQGPQAIAKATFQEALEGNMIAGAVNEAFFDSFDGLWERNDAFRSALTDELAEGGDGSAASEAYVASVKSLVDEAVAAARSAGATAADTSAVDKSLNSAVEKWLAAKSKEQDMKITTKAALKAAVAAFNPETSPAAHIGIIHKAAKDLDAEDELPATGLLAKVAPVEPNADLVRKAAILEMPADVRKHFDALAADDQTAFLAKTPAERLDIVTKANEGDPVVYTAADGTEIRKSHGPVALAAAKRADALEKRLDAMSGQLTETTLEKRANAYPNVARKVAVDMLKSIDQVGADSDTGKAMLASLDRMNKQATGLFKSLGATGGDEDVETGGDAEAVAEFNAEVDKVVARDKIGKAEAMSKVRTANPQLFKRAFPRPDEIDEEVDASA